MNPQRLLLPAALLAFAAGVGAGLLLPRGATTDNTASSAAPDAGAGQSGLHPAAAGPAEETGPDTAPAKPLRPMTLADLKAGVEDLDGFFYRGLAGMRQLADLADRIRLSDPAELARQLAASPQGAGEGAWELVMAAYAEQNTPAAWAFALGMKPGPARQSAILAVLAAAASQDPSRALAMAKGIDDPQMKQHANMLVVGNLARKDPRAALQLSAGLGSAAETEFSNMLIFRTWLRQDPEAAKAAAAQLEGRARDQAQQGLLSALVQTDPEAAWQYAQTLPPASDTRRDYKQQVIQSWAATDPPSALKAALTMEAGNSRQNAISTAVAAWSRTDFDDALRYAVALEDTTLRSDVFRAMSSGSTGNRQELLDALIEHMPVGDNFQNAVSNVFSSWARENPAAAAAAAAQLPPGRALSRATEQIAAEWARTGDQEQVLAWARQLPEGEARTNALESLFGQLSTQDPQQALAALATLGPDERGSALRSLAAGWSKTNPEAVLQWANTLPDAGERAGIVRDALSQWANSSPEAAAAHIANLPANQQEAATRSVVDRWASKDAEAAATWLARQPAGPAKDSSISVLARKIAPEDPATALQWAATISEERPRNRQTEQIARDWMNQDPAAASRWIQSSSLPPDTRNRLLKR
jgi:hypothetical protein